MEYNITIPEYTEYEKQLQNEVDFFKYMKLLEREKNNYLIIVAADDTQTGPLFTPEHSAAMMKALGLRLNMLQAYRQPYVAIVDGGEVIYEQTSQDLTKSITVNAYFGKHKLFVYSGGFDCADKFGREAVLKLDDVPFYGERGLNFFILNVKTEIIIDSYHYETFEDLAPGIPLWKPFKYADNIISLIEHNSSRGGVTYCFYTLPDFPPLGNRSRQEQIIKANGLACSSMRNDKKLLQQIFDNKIFDFCNDFKSVEDMSDAFYNPGSYEDMNEIMQFKDYSSNALNMRNGNRITTNQPDKHKRAVFFVGASTTVGLGADDAHTFESYLQRKLNKLIPKEGFIVYNYGRYNGGIRGMYRSLPLFSALPVKKGDIVFWWCNQPVINGLPYCDLSFISRRPHNYGEIFADYSGHFSANGNRIIADAIFDFLKEHKFFKNATMKFMRQGSKDTPDIDADDAKETELLTNYKKELAKFYDENIRPKVGAIVMNANPFTYGHRFLVETALKNSDYLIVFVVEEDKSEIPFKDRIALVRENTADLPNVFVMPSGEFIISAKTFSEYFAKESIQEQKIDTSKDVTLFAKEIAPALGISVRFAGKEPTDKITAQYNEDMAKILPQYGLEFIEIERSKTDRGDIISASTVRKLAKERDFEKLKALVPPATLRYLKGKY